MDIFERVKEVIRGVIDIPVDVITPASTPNDMSMSTLDITELMLALEDEFDIIIDNDESFSTVDELVNLVSSAA